MKPAELARLRNVLDPRDPESTPAPSNEWVDQQTSLPTGSVNNHPVRVMPGLVPGIHADPLRSSRQ
jgi:hypothetical protein